MAGMTDDEIRSLKDVQRGSPTVRAADTMRKFTGSMTGNRHRQVKCALS
jgi:hypothetical protein